jgi:hypothetical protein
MSHQETLARFDTVQEDIDHRLKKLEDASTSSLDESMDSFLSNVLETFAEAVVLTFNRDGIEEATKQCKSLNDDIVGKIKDDKRPIFASIIKKVYAEHLDTLVERIVMFERLLAKTKIEKEEFEKMVKEMCVN